jgi:hypothetical protein
MGQKRFADGASHRPSPAFDWRPWSREGVVERLDRLSPRPRVENEASSLAVVLDLDTELIPEIPALPEEIDDDSAALPVSEVISPG